MAALCDMCNFEVNPKEDATFLDAIFSGVNLMIFLNNARHIRCSPSRAQYIVHPDFGEPVVDDRERYDKRKKPPERVRDRELKMTGAWCLLQSPIEDVTIHLTDVPPDILD